MSHSPASAQAPAKTGFLACALLAGIFIARIFYVNSMGLVADEAYYWDWSRNLAWGYFDHPPMTAWMIFLGTRIFGTTVLGVKFMALAGCLGASLFTYFLAKKYLRTTSSFVVLLLLSNFVMLFGIGGLIATPDIPMVLFWSISMYAAYFYIFERKPGSWAFLGVCMGMGLLSKYLFALFILSLILFLLCSREHRRLLVSGGFLGALALAGLCIAPNLYWNGRHQWITIMYQFHHGMGGSGFPRFDYLGEFIGGQLGMLSIFPFILLLIAIVKELRLHRKNPQRLYLTVLCIAPLAFFTLSSLQKRVEANWPCGAYVTGLMLVALLWEEAGGARRTWMRRCMVFSVVLACLSTLIVLIHVQKPFLPLKPGNDPTSQTRGWKQWAAAIDSVRKQIDPNAALPLCTKFYQDAAMLSFYLPDHPVTHALNVHSRPSQYSLFESTAGIYGKRALIVIPCRDSLLPTEFSPRVEKATSVAANLDYCPGGRLDPYGVFTAVLRAQP